MAQVTRTQLVTTEAGGYQPAKHLIGLPGGSASGEATAIEGISGDVGVANQGVNYQFAAGVRDQRTGHHGAERQHATLISRVMTSPDTFVAVLRANVGEAGRERAGNGAGEGRGSTGLLSRAIGTYETNARVTAGQNKFRGTAFSMVL